ncbi:unnamed protein product [Rotaria sordida]|uniref:Poly [ADP-ribose] polymerase n=1 Tax=Rotaria sordida TaxID=392033 RepID=A0A818VGZ4_9BILA|nr:unnamed protein product [Rotaria sordida]
MMCESKTFVITYPKYKVNNQTILQEQFDENYEPTQEEIREYAIYIGIDPRKELHLLWLAREGIMKPLPPGWKSCQEENGELYYFNFDTGKSSWDHPCDEIYKARVIEERRKQPSSSTNLFNTNPRGTLSQKDRSKSTVSDYLSSGKKLLTMGAINNTSLITKNKVQTKKYDSQYVNSDNDELEEELMKSDDDDDEQSSDDFRKKVDFGIDLTLSARIERKEKEAPTTSALAASRSLNSIKNTDIKKADNRINSDDDDNERKKRAELAAEAAIRRLGCGQINALQPSTSLWSSLSSSSQDSIILPQRGRSSSAERGCSSSSREHSSSAQRQSRSSARKRWSSPPLEGPAKTVTATVNKGIIQVVIGDITAERVDVIIGSSSSKILKKAIIKVAGDDVQTSYNIEHKNNPNAILISTPPGALPCKRIFFVKWQPDKNETILRQSLVDLIWTVIQNSGQQNIYDEFCKQVLATQDADIREPSHYQVPKTWEKSRKNKICFELSNTADEYKSIVTNFNLPMKGKYTQIIRIERIQNERWYIQYLAHSRNFKKYLDKDTEKCLYHGCSEEAANAIMKSCFNRSFAGVNGKFMSHLVRFILITLLPLGTLYGVGVYFSSNAAYSHDYTKPNVNGERCMFWARVLVGNTTVGNSSMKTCPAEFDSTTDGKHIFVTYHDAQAYAEYLITYK